MQPHQGGDEGAGEGGGGQGVGGVDGISLVRRTPACQACHVAHTSPHAYTYPPMPTALTVAILPKNDFFTGSSAAAAAAADAGQEVEKAFEAKVDSGARLEAPRERPPPRPKQQRVGREGEGQEVEKALEAKVDSGARPEAPRQGPPPRPKQQRGGRVVSRLEASREGGHRPGVSCDKRAEWAIARPGQ